MSINQWISNLSGQKFHMPYDGECVLCDENGDHYVTIKEQGEQVVFIYSLPLDDSQDEIYRDALILNANPSFIGQASLAIGDESGALALSVFGQPDSYEQFENLWQKAQDIREVILESLEATW